MLMLMPGRIMHVWQRLRTLNQFCPLKDLSTYALSTARHASRNSSCSEVTAWLGKQPGPRASTAAAAAAANRAPICYTNIASSVLALVLFTVIADRRQALVLRTQAHACVDAHTALHLLVSLAGHHKGLGSDNSEECDARRQDPPHLLLHTNCNI